MVFTTAEIEILRLAGWLKGVPLELRQMDGGLFSPAGIESLCLYKLLYVTKNGLYLKLTPAGWSLLEALCYHYPEAPVTSPTCRSSPAGTVYRF